APPMLLQPPELQGDVDIARAPAHTPIVAEEIVDAIEPLAQSVGMDMESISSGLLTAPGIEIDPRSLHELGPTSSVVVDERAEVRMEQAAGECAVDSAEQHTRCAQLRHARGLASTVESDQCTLDGPCRVEGCGQVPESTRGGGGPDRGENTLLTKEVDNPLTRVVGILGDSLDHAHNISVGSDDLRGAGEAAQERHGPGTVLWQGTHRADDEHGVVADSEPLRSPPQGLGDLGTRAEQFVNEFSLEAELCLAQRTLEEHRRAEDEGAAFNDHSRSIV